MYRWRYGGASAKQVVYCRRKRWMIWRNSRKACGDPVTQKQNSEAERRKGDVAMGRAELALTGCRPACLGVGSSVCEHVCGGMQLGKA